MDKNGSSIARPKPMRSRQKLDCAVLIGAVALTRFLFRSHSLYDLDSVDFALAMRRFDPSVFQPHPPGYYLYVWLGRLMNAVFHDPNAALVAISIAASCGAAVMIYRLTLEWFGSLAARFAGALFLVSPLAWFHGTVALTYIVEAFFSALLGYLCWHIYQGSVRSIIPAAVVLGLSAGVRPSSLLFLGPLFLFSLRRAPRKRALAGIGVLLLTLLGWFVPMLYASGGPAAYFSALSFLWHSAAGRQNAVGSFLLLSLARFCTLGAVFVLCFGSAAALLARALSIKPGTGPARPPEPSGIPALPPAPGSGAQASSVGAHTNPPQAAFCGIWITPAVLFFTFVFFKFINSGYLLVIFPPLCASVAGWASDWYLKTPLWAPLKPAVIALSAAINVAAFLDAPVYCSYREVRNFEAELQTVERALPQVAATETTLLIGFDSHFLGFRHAGYYFPNYTVAEYPEIRLPAGDRFFMMQHQDTRLTPQLPSNRFTAFVFFPLPQQGTEYHQYLEDVCGKLPPNLQVSSISGFEFLSAPIEDLPFLLPTAGGRSTAVSTPRDSPEGPVYSR